MIEVGWIEAVGITLILFSSFFKFFFSDALTDLHQSEVQVRIEQKLDYVFVLLAHHHRRAYPDDSEWRTAVNLDGIAKHWEATADQTMAGRQAGNFRRFENIAFLVGSALLVGARVLPLLYPSRFLSV